MAINFRFQFLNDDSVCKRKTCISKQLINCFSICYHFKEKEHIGYFL